MEQGDTIGIIALSGACEEEKVFSSKKYFESLGYNIVLSKNICDEKRYLAGSDEDKINELHNFFTNPDIKLILCARGGYGAIRLINKINYDIIKCNPKPICGFSDVTALLLMIYKKTGIITYHSPMACTDFSENISEFTAKNFFNAINSNVIKCDGNKVYNSGSARGILWGGNLATVASLCGQDFIPNKDFIFFTEDLNENVYKIDRMFQQLMNIPEFIKHCKGIALGEFLGVDNEAWLQELFLEIAKALSVPVVSGYKISHAPQKITLPIGKIAELNNLQLTT